MRKTLIFVLLLSLVACSKEMYKSRVNKVKPSQGVYQNSNIVNTWCSEEDNNWKLVFTSDYKCYQYYSNTLKETDTYTISNTSPQCGMSVPITNYTSYLKLKNASTGDSICYEINGITEKTMSLRPIDRGGTVLFYRQTISQHKSDDIKKYEYKGIDSFKGDTLAFIMYNFIENKSQYINKPASVLFSKLLMR